MKQCPYCYFNMKIYRKDEIKLYLKCENCGTKGAMVY